MSQITVTYIDHMGSDLSVVNAARVSFGKKSSMDEDNMGVWYLKDKDKKLIQYLAKHKHLSPFGHCFASFHVKAPVFVARQLVSISSYVGMRYPVGTLMKSLSSMCLMCGGVVVLTRSRGLMVYPSGTMVWEQGIGSMSTKSWMRFRTFTEV